MKKTSLITLITFGAVLAIVGGAALFHALRWEDPEDFDRRAGTPRMRLIRAFGVALRQYAYETGAYPYAPRGSDAALYRLQSLLPSAALQPHGISFDDERKEIINCPLRYINRPGLEPDTAPPTLVIMEEKNADDQGGRWCLCNDGHPDYVTAEGGSLLGREL
jgi:hypothetical protein